MASAVFLKQIEQLDLIDTDAIEMMDMPFDTITTWLREDEVTHTMDHEAALSNAPKVEGDFIEIVKVLV